MDERSKFIKQISQLGLFRVEQAIALLWFYRQNQIFDERTASELADDLLEEGLGRPNVTNLNRDLTISKKTVKGKRKKTFQINVKFLNDLDNTYGKFLAIKSIAVSDKILQFELVNGTRKYLEEMVHEINGTFEYGFYNSSAVILRRLMESLIIEVYIKNNLTSEIRQGGAFLMLDGIISNFVNNSQIILSRNSPKTMKLIKELGDTAAHDRTYLTKPNDIEEYKLPIRKLIQELLFLAGISK